MSKQQEDIETKKKAKSESFGSMEFKRSSNARPMGSRNLEALKMAELKQENKEIGNVLKKHRPMNAGGVRSNNPCVSFLNKEAFLLIASLP